MKLNVIESEAKSVIIEFEDADRGIAQLIKDKIIENKDIDFAGVVKEHPEVAMPKLVVKGDKAKSVVLKAIEEIQDELKAIAAQVPKK